MSDKKADDQMYAYKCPVCGMGVLQKLKNDTYQCVSCGEVVPNFLLQPSKGTPEEEFNKWKSEVTKKKAFEGDDKWQSQKEVVPFGMGERGWQGYEPYKRGSTDNNEQTMAMYWDMVRDLFFEKGNRWSGVLKQLKNMYSELTIGQIEELEHHVRYYLDQYKSQIESKKQGASLQDAIEFFIKHQDIIGIPGNIDSKTHTVEFSSGKKLSFDETVKLFIEHKQKTADYDGFFGSPKDLGKDPSGDFPAVSWLPKGQEDLNVNEDIRTASKKITTSFHPALGGSEIKHEDHIDVYQGHDTEDGSKLYECPKGSNKMRWEILEKKAEIEINEEAMNKAIEEYIPTLPEKVWIETYGDHEADRYVNNFADEMREHGRRVPMDMSDVLESHFENLTVVDWVDMYHDEMRDHLIDEFYMTKSLEDLETYYPGLVALYNKHLQTKTALQNPLTDEQQNQIAAKYGPMMNTTLMYYAEALKNGHAKDRALAYALDEMKKMNTVIDSAKLVEAIDVYIGK